MCKTLGEWYWKYGVQRGNDPEDPDRAMRKIPIGSWLDVAERISRRMETLRKEIPSRDRKASVVLWGPSQTGKSTMLSRYIDGTAHDGSDSALTWEQGHPVRFSPPVEIGADLENLYPDTLVFNPFNHNSDASGVATRYVLRDAEAADVNPSFPVEIRLVSRVQLLHALALGYCTECRPPLQRVRFDQDHFLSDLAVASAPGAGSPRPEAYALLKDVADVIELMRSEERFADLFSLREWDKKIRPNFVECGALLASVAAAQDKMAEVLWDKSPKMTAFYNRLETLRETLQEEWKGAQRVVATAEAAALLLDIDTFRSVAAPNGEHARKVQEKVSRLAWEFDAIFREVRISVGKIGSDSAISGEKFGLFQTLCAELIVPVRRDVLCVPEKEPFLRLMEKCDLIDLPGLSNKNRGTNASPDDVDLVDLDTAGNVDLFTRVVKEGKTQGFVYSYAREFGVDAFVILARADRYPGKSALLSGGVGAWIRSYVPDWKKGRPSAMPVFLNMTFFSNVVNNVALNGLGTGLTPVVGRIQDTLTFSGKETAKWFVTTYPQFPDGRIDQPQLCESVVTNILADKEFCPRTGLGRKELEAVFRQDGGIGFMLQEIAGQIDPDKRLGRCREILQKDRETLERMLVAQLPPEEGREADNRKHLILEAIADIESRMEKAAYLASPPARYMEMAREFKKIFAASRDMFDPIPLRAAQDDTLSDFLKNQVAKWFDSKVKDLSDYSLLDDEKLKAVFLALRDAVSARIEGRGGLKEYVRTCLGQLANQRMGEAARFPFALAFGNILRCGTWRRETDRIDSDRKLDELLQAADEMSGNRESSPYWTTVFEPLLQRMRELGEEDVRPGARPPQPGDDALADLLRKIQTP